MIRWFIFAAGMAMATSSYAQQAAQANFAELRVLDRTTGTIQDVKMGFGQEMTVGPLTVTMQGCRYPNGAINADAFAYLNIVTTETGNGLFDGWMVASSPGLNALEHPRYDIWVLRCKTS